MHAGSWLYDRGGVLLLVAVMVLLNVPGYLRWEEERNPDNALNQAAEAIRRHDASLFEAWVDVDAVAASYYEQHLLPERVQANAADDAKRARDIQSVARRLRRWVITSRTDETESPRLTLLGAMLRGALTHGTANVKQESRGGRTIIKTVELEDDEGRAARLDIRVDRQRGGTWRIMEVTNVEEVVGSLRRAEIARIRKRQKEIDTLIVAGVPQFTIEQASRGATNRVYKVQLTPIDAARVEWSAICSSGNSIATDAGHVLSFEGLQPKTVVVTCSCTASPCGGAMVRIDAVTRRSNTKRIERIEPLPLD